MAFTVLILLALLPLPGAAQATAGVRSPEGAATHIQRSAAPRRYNVRVPIGRAISPAKNVRVEGPADRPLVVIDAGHGGHDPGSISPSGVREKDVTLAVALAIRDRLLATGRVRVALTRTDDRFVILPERFAVARSLGAELFLSIHADSAPDEQASGATLYTLSEIASDREAARLAARENRADILNGVDLSAERSQVANILIGLTQRETMGASARFAGVLQRESGAVPFKLYPHRFASLMVLKAPDVPSVLYETGYLSNEADVEWLTSEAGQDAIAAGVARAVAAHFARQLAR